VKRVDLTRGAQLEVRAAAHWYSEQEVGLGEEFVAEIDRVLAKIAGAAARHPVWHRDRPYRKALVRRFPYVIFFLDEADAVRVLAVAHQKRKPGYWLRRIR
jgi:toxin ParE1/3/4